MKASQILALGAAAVVSAQIPACIVSLILSHFLRCILKKDTPFRVFISTRGSLHDCCLLLHLHETVKDKVVLPADHPCRHPTHVTPKALPRPAAERPTLNATANTRPRSPAT